MRLFCETLMEELQKNYRCYGFSYNMTQNMQHQPINVLGALSPVAIQHGRTTYEIRLEFKQDAGIPQELAMQNVLMRGSSALGEALYRCVKNVRMQMGAHPGYAELDYTVDLILGDGEHIKELTKKIRNIEWNRYSDEFNAEIDKTLKSE